MTNFKLDVDKKVLSSLMHNPGDYIVQATAEMLSQGYADFIENSFRLHIPESNIILPSDNFHSLAFYGGSVLAITAFDASDLEVGTYTRVQDRLKATGTSDEGDATRATKTEAESLKRESRLGLNAHPEINKHLELLMGHYVEASQDVAFGFTVSIGLGYTIAKLDELYEADQLVEVFGQNPSTVNWDTELDWLDGGLTD